MIHLNEKEKRFIELKSQGLKMEDIAVRLLLSDTYVYQLANDVYKKTGTVNGSSLVRWGYENGILKINEETLPTNMKKTG